MSIKITVEIKQCVDCKYHEVRPDPDPHDWFNRDDVKVVCTHAKDENDAPRDITVACRPYNIRKETDVPDWCPLRTESN